MAPGTCHVITGPNGTKSPPGIHRGYLNVPGGKTSRSDGLATQDRHVPWRFSARYI